jgi:hypothetical protein
MPTETILWQSTGIWDNGHDRTITKHGAFDPDDSLTEVRAGTGRKFHIDGLGTGFLSGNQSRIYTHVKHDGKVALSITYTPMNNLENLSVELFSRHDEAGAPANRFGGVTYVFYLDSVKSKVEYFHKKYSKGQMRKLTKKLRMNQKYAIKIVGEKIPFTNGTGADVTVEGFIDYNQDGNYVSVGKFTQHITKQQAPGVLKQALYYRIRTNSKDDSAIPKDIPLTGVKFVQIS